VCDTFVTKTYDDFVKSEINSVQIFVYNSNRINDYNVFMRSLTVEITEGERKRLAELDIVVQAVRIDYPYVGNVRVISNKTEYTPLENWHHGYSPELNMSGRPLSLHEVMRVVDSSKDVKSLPTVHYFDDFKLSVDSSFLKNGVLSEFHRSGQWNLYLNEYKTVVNQWGTEVVEYTKLGGSEYIDNSWDNFSDFGKLYSLLEKAEDGVYILELDMWWHSKPQSSSGFVGGSGSAMQYFFKIIVGNPKITEPDLPIARTGCSCHLDNHPDFVIIGDRRFCINATHASFTSSDFTVFDEDLAQIAKLTKLIHLSISKSKITDLSPVAALKNLEYLSVSGGTFSDVTPVAGLTKLWHLSLYAGGITDISPLESLNVLSVVSLVGNKITDVSALTNTRKFAGMMYLAGNPIADLSVLDSLVERFWYIDVVEKSHFDTRPSICQHCGKEANVCSERCVVPGS